MFDLVVAVGIGYLIGAIPNADIVARLRGTRIFEVGSGNMGAMNAARNLGFAFGLLVFALDVGKGALVTFLGLQMAAATGAVGLQGLAFPLAAGIGAVAGHAWSPYVRFRGGKALATTLGLSLPLYPLGGFYGLILITALALILKRTVLASILTMVFYPALVFASLVNRSVQQDVVFAILTGVLPISILVIFKHLVSRPAKPASEP